MTKNTQKPSQSAFKANVIRYIVQDMLEGISSGISIDLDDFEREVLEVINKTYVNKK